MIAEYTEQITKYLQTRQIKPLIYSVCKVELSKGQCDIAESVIYNDHRYTVINCMTQYGKSFTIGAALNAYIISETNKSIVVIAPTNDQAKIIMNYFFEHLQENEILKSYLPASYKDIAERLETQVTKNRIKFLNDVVLEIKSAEGTGDRLMGFGYDLCLSGDTLILTDKGQIKIRDIVDNHLNVNVACYNHNLGIVEYKPITDYYKNLTNDDMYLINDVKLTSHHPVFCNGEYIFAKNVKLNDVVVYGYDLNIFDTKIKKVKKIPRDKYTYNIDVKDNHNYFANNMLVHNCIIDESCLISQEVYASKIHRMLIKSPDARVIMIGNPWHKNNFFYSYYLNPNAVKIHVEYNQALSEGRISQEQLNEAKELNTPIHFQVLYKSEFPDDSEFQLIPENHIKRSKNKKLKKDVGFVIASLDVASMGDDFSVLTLGRVIGNKLFVYDIRHYSKKNPADLSLIIKQIMEEQKVIRIYVDATGIGEGVYANLNNFGFDSIAIKAGGKPSNKYKYTNIKQMFRYKKDELYWMLRTLFENNRIYFSYDINRHEIDTLTKELLRIEWTIDISKGLTRIIDFKKTIDGRTMMKSPDYADSMSYMCAEFVNEYYVAESVINTTPNLSTSDTTDPSTDNVSDTP